MPYAIARLIAATLAIPCAHAWAQSEWSTAFTHARAGVAQVVRMMPVPGAGAELRLVAVGGFTAIGGIQANCIAYFDGEEWQPLGEGLTTPPHGGAIVYGVTLWDPDGPGPEEPLLVAAGDFTHAGGVEARNIAAWDGDSWSAVGGGLFPYGHASDVVAFDPDGGGPRTPLLVVAGDNSTGRGVLAFDGAGWQPIGEFLPSAEFRLATFDADGSGPGSSVLCIGGNFAYELPSGEVFNDLIMWDGDALQAPIELFGGPPEALLSLNVVDLGGGPELYIGFTGIANGVDINGLAIWDGVQVRDSGFDGRVNDITLWDDDGDPGTPRNMVIAGFIEQPAGTVEDWPKTAILRDGAWEGLPGIHSRRSSAGRVLGVAAVPVGDSERLVACGDYEWIDGTQYAGLSEFDPAGWGPFGRGLFGDRFPNALAAVIYDDPGPAPPRLIVGGRFRWGGPRTVNHIGAWDGADWSALGDGANAAVRALAVHDPDGSGPAPQLLVAGGDFTDLSGAPARYVGGWDGDSWLDLGSDLNGHVYALKSSLNGSGEPQLLLGGAFTAAGGAAAGHIATWDSAGFQPLGTGMNGAVRAIDVWDPDGAGPEEPLVVAGGSFTTADGKVANRVAAWTGSEWIPLGEGFDDTVRAFAQLDPDGPGPMPARLFAGGFFLNTGTEPAHFVAEWTGDRWQGLGPLGDATNEGVYSACSFDLDGPGPEPERLIVAGHISWPGDIAVYDSGRWASLGQLGAHGLAGVAQALLPLDVPAAQGLLVVGNFVSAGATRWSRSAGHAALLVDGRVCAADLDRDGALTFFDFLLFQDLFVRKQPQADFDGDGEFTFFDFLAFQGVFAAGCS